MFVIYLSDQEAELVVGALEMQARELHQCASDSTEEDLAQETESLARFVAGQVIVQEKRSG